MASNEKLVRHIMFVAPSAYSLGGVQTWLDYLAQGIERHGYHSTVALTSGLHHDSDAYIKDHPFNHSVKLVNSTGSLQGRVEAIEDQIDRLQPDLVVVINIADAYQAVINLRSRNATNAKLVGTIHGIHPALIASQNTYADAIDAVISTNRLTQRLINDKTRIKSGRSLYAPYGVVTPDSAYQRPKTSDSICIAYVGRLEEDQKRIADLMEIVDELLRQEVAFTLLVAGNGEEYDKLMAWIDQTDHQAAIQYLGVLTATQLANKVYQKADVLLLTSHWETGPIVAWEAMSHGVLLISSRYIGYAEESSLINNENCLLFEIGNTEQAVTKIKMAFDTELRSKLTTAARKLVDDRYTIEKSVATWASCFNHVMQNETKYHIAGPPRKRDEGRMTDSLYTLFGRKGLVWAECIRKLLKRRFEHSSAGSEWPHCYENVPSSSQHLLSYVQRPKPQEHE